ncbi:hypothetical protein [Methylorubrum sp. SB2]|uniref:hypothetical protein n=1 Tax=Methylorubrum subtropicum TaxID=3138812 RepID=UPI00313C5A39
MNYQDFYFRFPNRQTALSATSSLQPPVANVDHIGAIAGGPTGWHVNLRLQQGQAVPAGMTAYQIAAPLYPKRVWAANVESMA